MPKNEDWIDGRLSEAKKAHPTVTEAVATRIRGLLMGKLTERQVPATELAKIARTLIADMITAPPKAKVEQ